MKQYVAEFFGTFWLVLGGCGSAVLAAAFPDVGIGLLGVSFAFGLTVLDDGIRDRPYFWLPPEPGSIDRPYGQGDVFLLINYCFTSLHKCVGAIVAGGMLCTLSPVARQGSIFRAWVRMPTDTANIRLAGIP